MGIDFEEKAFYDILKMCAEKYDFTYPEDKMIYLTKEIKRLVNDKAKYTNFLKKTNIRAALQMDLIVLMDENGYPPEPQDEVYQNVINFKKYLQQNIRVTIGKTDEISLTFARKKALAFLEQIQNGINPNIQKRAMSKEKTVGELFEEFLERHINHQVSESYAKDVKGIYKYTISQWQNKRLTAMYAYD